jgi:hypothetical protein
VPGAATLVRGGNRFVWVSADGTVGEPYVIGATDAVGAAVLEEARNPDGGAALEKRVMEDAPRPPWSCADPVSVLALRRQYPVPTLQPLPERRRTRESVARQHGRMSDPEFLLHLARSRLETALGSPTETLVTLAREEERIERALGRENNAGQATAYGHSSELTEYRREVDEFQGAVDAHHRRLQERLERVARTTVPHLAEIVGPRTAARLVARAGSPEALARMSASRLQLLGSRRRPAAGRGPRFGVIARAERMEEVPAARRGRYARSLAALAAIAVRIDTFGSSDRVAELRTRRDRRVDDLKKGL